MSRVETVIAVCSQKGGVGKTTLALNAGLALALYYWVILGFADDREASMARAIPGWSMRASTRRSCPPITTDDSVCTMRTCDPIENVSRHVDI